MRFYTPAQLAKFGVALVGLAAQVVDAGLVPEQYRAYGAVVLALATALGVYRMPNAEAPVSPRSVVGLPYEPVEEPPADETGQ